MIGGLLWLSASLVMRIAWFTPRYQTIPSPAVIMERLQPLSRLETARQTTTHVVEVRSSTQLPSWLVGERVLLIARAEAIAGIDLSHIRPEHIQVQGDKVILFLPPPQIFSVHLQESETRVYDRQRGLLTFRPDREIESRARQQALKEAQESALQGGLLALARQNAVDQLTRLLQGAGIRMVEVQFQVANAKVP